MVLAVILGLHSWLRWGVVGASLAVFARALAGWLARRPAWNERDGTFARIWVGATDAQILLGLALYFSASPIAELARHDFRAAGADPQLRFFGLVHPALMMLVAMATHVAWIGVRRTDAARALPASRARQRRGDRPRRLRDPLALPRPRPTPLPNVSKMNLSPQLPKIHRLRVLAWIEGISLLVLVGIAMPLKHLAHIPEATQIVGMLHGLSFVLYAVAIADALGTRAITGKQAGWALLGAFLPGGSFLFARRLRS